MGCIATFSSASISTSTTTAPTATPSSSNGTYQDIFSVESNSTVTELPFNSTNSELTFVVNGPSETAGYVEVKLAKSLISNPEGIKVYLDGSNLGYEVSSSDDSWLLFFTYAHSTG